VSTVRTLPRALLLALLAFIAISAAVAQDYAVKALVQPAEGINDGQPFQFIIQIEGEANPQVTPPRISGLQNVSIISGPNSSSRFYWSNGKASSNFQLVYTMLAEGPGPASIPALELQVNARTYRTEPLSLQVAAGPSRPQPQPSQEGGQQQQSDTYDVFIVAKLGADEVWVGQPVPLTVTLLASQRVSNLVWRQEPSFSNAWVESLEVNPDDDAYRTVVEGRTYTAYPVVRKVLIPPGPGPIEIEPYVAQISVREGGQDLFDLFSFGRAQTIVRRSEKLTLNVRQLPPGEPEGFGGAVGSFKLRASFDRQQALVNDAVALKATVEGEGILSSVDPPTFTPSADLKVFDPRVVETHRSARGKMISKKSWEWLIVPLVPGELQLPELHFAYFDPAREEYRVAGSGSLQLSVQKDDSGSTPSAPPRGDIQLQRRDLAFIKVLRGNLSELHPRIHRQSLFLLLLCLPLLVVPLFIIFGRRRARRQQDLGLARSRKARSRAKRRFRNARRKLEHADAAAFHEDVARSLVDYIADRFNRSAAGLTYDLAEELLASRGIAPELSRRFRSCLESCDFARYVPAASQQSRRAELLEEAVQVVEQLGKTL
jgi:hypothetical protein